MNKENKLIKKEYALVKIGKKQLLELYGSYDGSEKSFREYLKKNEEGFEKGLVEYYALREDDKYIAQITVMYENTNIEEAAIKDKRVYFNNFNVLKNRSYIGFENIFIDLIINKLNSRKPKQIFEYTISIGTRERKIRELIEQLGFEEYKEFFNEEKQRKELLFLRKDRQN